MNRDVDQFLDTKLSDVLETAPAEVRRALSVLVRKLRFGYGSAGEARMRRVCYMTPVDLLDLNNFGQVAFKELNRFFSHHGAELRDPQTPIPSEAGFLDATALPNNNYERFIACVDLATRVNPDRPTAVTVGDVTSLDSEEAVLLIGAETAKHVSSVLTQMGFSFGGTKGMLRRQTSPVRTVDLIGQLVEQLRTEFVGELSPQSVRLAKRLSQTTELLRDSVNKDAGLSPEPGIND